MELCVNLKDHGENASQKRVFARRMDVFKKTFNTPFPLFPDNDFTIHKAPGDVGSRYFIVIKIDNDGPHEVVHSEWTASKTPMHF
jgi:hypothetical protein